jgi:hypothetical protein
MLSTAVADVTNPDGTTARLVGSSRRTLYPAQRAALKPGEIPVSGSGHAEQTVLNAAKCRGQTVKAISSSRAICAECRSVLKKTRIKIVEATT